MEADIGMQNGTPPSSPSTPDDVPAPVQARSGDGRAAGLGS
jgi:hypothetical protein